MDLTLDPDDLALQERARRLTREHLLPHEAELEEQGRLAESTREAIKAATRAARLGAINHAPEDGGQGLTLFQQILVQEAWGGATGNLWGVPWTPSRPLRAGTEAQRARYLRPACRGEISDAYAITEAEAGSDASMVRTTARWDGTAFVIRGEKWHVTGGDLAAVLLVHALVDGDPAQATVFLVDRDSPGLRVVRTPRYTNVSAFEHPIFALDDVRVGPEQVLGEVGSGDQLTKEWFVEERFMIGARTVGAAIRALELATQFATTRVQFGRPIASFQGIEFQLADMAAEVLAAKSLLYRVGFEASQGGLDRKATHALASAVKLVCSEMAGRVVDRAVQIHGGRGYMREQPVERLARDLRVDRIWEGTSEIQRMILGNELRKRGPGLFVGWPGAPTTVPAES
ncbi:MAG TPA: acyl-CoA dehydrogenase [Verrucomicrobiae bacterium]|nr:acyl-CoA dehydrogenase [Verrucomicrobiae bacterium]